MKALEQVQLQAVTARRARLESRVIWSAMLFGEAAFFAVAVFVNRRTGPLVGDLKLLALLTLLSYALSFLLPPIGYGVRAACFRRRGEDGSVDPIAYSSGNIVLWACCEGSAMFATVVILLQGSIGWLAAPLAVPVAVQLLALPRGRELEPRSGASP